ncbi:ABC-type glycerol-3-phosphate transport system permease component [Paenibacillus sp. V4I3]|uniref:carbohydrate ABC transporter permease n=1 Tax=unclassified Paenibacillus TaxID=185978 RepID=UPI00278459D2|nr:MULTISPECIES: carbohydrate ABC transporter permease [unclassified Paenibacillus]MDQ0877378.1 ABC-type glycerol-3-phosphate transport system permease component [Paenibacillus sp. V4I3]MDQ0886757.1 ABC-type glycerol-3-phosphate transport system permease component [Paenibacillus sp. V4I9]
MIRNTIKEKGQRSIKIIAYSITFLFIVLSLVPLVWMLASSLKDESSILAYPPKWLPAIPHSVQVEVDYSGQELKDAQFYEKDAMKATWYPWASNIRDSIGEVVVKGIKDGKLIYSANTTGSSFHYGRNLVVPTTLFNDNLMNVKLPIIHEKKLSSFQWLGDSGGIEKGSGNSQELVSTHFRDFYANSKFVSGKVLSIEEKPRFWSIFDSYLVLNKVTKAASNDGYGISHYFLNSLIVTFVTIVSQLLFGGLAGYALSFLIKNKKLQLGLVMFFLATLMIPDIALLIPLYLTMNQLHLVDTLWAIILPHTAWGIVIFLFKGFFDQLPRELIQAARVDGASEFRTFYQIVIPMSVPIFTVVSVLTFLPVWNEFLWPLVVARSSANWTLTVALNNLQNQASIVSENMLMASGVISMIPLLIVFITCQKLIEKGASFTGVKG